MIGEVVGSYRVLSKLGEGGMGVVYTAEHITLGSPAAIKCLSSELCRDEGMVQRFFMEAKAATRIRHPGIIQVFDFGIHPRSGGAYFVMELLDGENLAAFLRRGTPSL